MNLRLHDLAAGQALASGSRGPPKAGDQKSPALVGLDGLPPGVSSQPALWGLHVAKSCKKVRKVIKSEHLRIVVLIKAQFRY